MYYFFVIKKPVNLKVQNVYFEFIFTDFSVVVESSDTGGSDSSGGITSPDGPGPSMLGSLDKIFKSVKDFDQYQCIERMM